MENNVIFDKDELLLIADESLCNYSGLPSVSSYVIEEEEDQAFIMGHS